MALLGYSKFCGPRAGGILTVYLAEAEDVDSFTLAVAPGDEDLYDTVTMLNTATFTKYEFDSDSCNFTTAIARENGSSVYTPTIEWNMGKLSPQSRKAVAEIVDASNCGMIAIVKDASGQHWVAGYSELHGKDRPLEVASGTMDTGKALADANVVTISISATSGEAPRAFSGTVPLPA